MRYLFSPCTENYQYIPTSCRIANGLGVAVIAAALFTFLSMLVRNAHKLRAVLPQQEQGIKQAVGAVPTPLTELDNYEVSTQQ